MKKMNWGLKEMEAGRGSGGWETMGETGDRNVPGTGGRNSESASLAWKNLIQQFI